LTDRELQSGTSNKSRRGFLKLSGLTAGVALLPAARTSLWTGGDAPVVKTTTGPLRGLARASTYAYLGVPYAQAERFAAPVAAQPWTATRDARAFAGAAPEPDLHLSIWTPTFASTARPVWVRIAGGGFQAGDSRDFNGSAFAEQSAAVVVSVNHRAGLLGYLHLSGEDLAASNHAGNLDLVAALQWVRRNIRAFGGDPGNVTLFSGMGGEAKVSCLLHMPLAEGLFHRAFLQTGAIHRPRRGSASQLTEAILHELHLDRSREKELRRVPLGTLLAAAAAAKAKLPPDAPSEFRPRPDGRFLKAGWFDSPAAMAAQDPSWPVLTNSVSTEGPLHRAHFQEDPSTHILPDAEAFRGSELGRVRTTRNTFTSAADPQRGGPSYSVEVVTHNVVGSQGRVLRGHQLRTIAANATLMSLAQDPRA
jgi:para-nitrobenzyl esterase